MDFASTYTLESEAFPGVVVTLKRMGPKRRAEVELSISAARAKQRDLSVRHQSTREKLIAAVAASPKDEDGKPIEAKLLPEAIALAIMLQDLAHEASALERSQIHPAFVKAAFKAFGGSESLTYEGKPATAEMVCECGPDELFDELVAAVNGNGYIAQESAANLSSPSTSAGPEGGEAKSTTAPNAKSGTSTSGESAAPDIPTA